MRALNTLLEPKKQLLQQLNHRDISSHAAWSACCGRMAGPPSAALFTKTPPGKIRQVHLCAPMALYRDRRYDEALDLVTRLHPSAVVVGTKGMWDTTNKWLSGFPEAVRNVDGAYFLTLPGGMIGAGQWSEFVYFANHHPRLKLLRAVSLDGAVIKSGRFHLLSCSRWSWYHAAGLRKGTD